MRAPGNLVGLRAHMRIMMVGLTALVVAVAVASSFAQNGVIKPMTPTMADVMSFMYQYRQLPEYAQVKLTETHLFTKFNTSEVPSQFANLRDKWAGIIGKNNWIYFHHYCMGIVRFNEALIITGGSENEKRDRKYLLNWSLEEFKFVEKSRTDSSFPLWSQLYIYQFQIYSHLGQPVLAQQALQRSKAMADRQQSPRKD